MQEMLGRKHTGARPTQHDTAKTKHEQDQILRQPKLEVLNKENIMK